MSLGDHYRKRKYYRNKVKRWWRTRPKSTKVFLLVAVAATVCFLV